MKRLTNWIFFLATICFSGGTYAQNLTGIWRGTFYNPAEYAMVGPSAKYRYEVQIDNNSREAKGVTYSYQTTRFYGKASIVGVWSPGSKNLVLQEDRMLDLKIVGGGDGCLMTCYLTYREENGKEYLEGTYTSYNMNNKNQGCGGGRVFLERVPDTDFELEDFLLKKENNHTPPKTGVKPGQEDFLVKKPVESSTSTKPNNGSNPSPKPAAKPPAAQAKPGTPSKSPNLASKPPAAKPNNPTPQPAVPPRTLGPSSSQKPLFPGATPPAIVSAPQPAPANKKSISGGQAPVLQPEVVKKDPVIVPNVPAKPAVTPAPAKPPIAKEPVVAKTNSPVTKPATPKPTTGAAIAKQQTPSPANKKLPGGNTAKPTSPPAKTDKKEIAQATPLPGTNSQHEINKEKPDLNAGTRTETQPVKPAPAPVPTPPVLKERKNELFKTIVTNQRFIEISFFDNGEIDGDTISIYNNNRLVASRKGLSAKPITIKIELDENDSQQDIIMVAENLGTIPPNTALMIVNAGKDRYTLNLSSTEQKNAMVRFKYQDK